MAEKGEQKSYLFEVSLDERIDADSVTFRVLFKEKLPDKVAFEKVVKGWAEEGIEKGFGEGKMHYLDDETDESGGGGFEWNEDEHWVEFFVDMGSANDEALEALYSKFSSFNQIKEVKIGSGYEW